MAEPNFDERATMIAQITRLETEIADMNALLEKVTQDRDAWKKSAARSQQETLEQKAAVRTYEDVVDKLVDKLGD